MSKPKLLDLYSCAGGAGRGYTDAGFDVYGVDLNPQPRYPYTFIQFDAIDALTRLLDGQALTFGGDRLHLADFDAIHASPPCQRYSAGTRALTDNQHPDLLDPTRQLVQATGLPYVIENVPGAPLYEPVTLCGRMFGLTATDDDGTTLQLDRHRIFETNWWLTPPSDCRPHRRDVQVAGAYAGARRDKAEARNIRHGGYVPSYTVQQQLLRIDWTTEAELQQAIPPIFSEWIGGQLIAHLRAERAPSDSSPGNIHGNAASLDRNKDSVQHKDDLEGNEFSGYSNRQVSVVIAESSRPMNRGQDVSG